MNRTSSLRQWELDSNPYLAAILDVRLRAAGDFSPEKIGTQGAAYDRAVLDCYWAVHAVVEAQAIEAQRAATGNTDAVHESAVPEGGAHD